MATMSHIMAHLSGLCKTRQYESQCRVVKNKVKAMRCHYNERQLRTVQNPTQLMFRTATGITSLLQLRMLLHFKTKRKIGNKDICPRIEICFFTSCDVPIFQLSQLEIARNLFSQLVYQSRSQKKTITEAKYMKKIMTEALSMVKFSSWVFSSVYNDYEQQKRKK